MADNAASGAAGNALSGSVVGGRDLKAELDPYDPPSTTQAFVWAGLIGAFVIVAVVLAALYGTGTFDVDGALGIQGSTN